MTDRGLGVASMGKASRTKVESTRREKIAAQRAAERRSEQRRRILIASGSVVVVLAVVLVFVIVKLNGGKPSASAAQGLSNGPTGSALTAVVDKVTSVPASTLNTVGDGGGAVTGQAHHDHGQRVGADRERQARDVLHGRRVLPVLRGRALGDDRGAEPVRHVQRDCTTVHSAVANGAGNAEPDPDTPTWTFVHATYSSPYLTFTPVEIQTNIPDPSTGTYTTLQTPTAAQQALLTKYDALDTARSRSSTSATST